MFDNKDNELDKISTNSYFEVEMCSSESEVGGIMQWINPITKEPTKFRLRHLNSGKLLTSYSK